MLGGLFRVSARSPAVQFPRSDARRMPRIAVAGAEVVSFAPDDGAPYELLISKMAGDGLL
jgi:hypothetical protein